MWLRALLALALGEAPRALDGDLPYWRLDEPIVVEAWADQPGRCTGYFFDAKGSGYPEVDAAACAHCTSAGLDTGVCYGHTPDPLAVCGRLETCQQLCRLVDGCVGFDWNDYGGGVGRCFLHGIGCLRDEKAIVPAAGYSFHAKDDTDQRDLDCSMGRGVNLVIPDDTYQATGLYQWNRIENAYFQQGSGRCVIRPAPCGWTWYLPVDAEQLAEGGTFAQWQAGILGIPDEVVVLSTVKDPFNCATPWDGSHDDLGAPFLYDLFYGVAHIEGFTTQHYCPHLGEEQQLETGGLLPDEPQPGSPALGGKGARKLAAEAPEASPERRLATNVWPDCEFGWRTGAEECYEPPVVEPSGLQSGGDCPATTYRTSPLLFYCAGGSDSAVVSLDPSPAKTLVSTLCPGLLDVRIDLSATGDIDVQLWLDTTPAQQLTGDNTDMTAEEYPEWHLIGRDFAEEFFNGALYRYSGWSGNQEWIEVTGGSVGDPQPGGFIDRSLRLLAKNYADTSLDGDVTYSYAGVVTCADSGAPCGCESCEDYPQCDGLVVDDCCLEHYESYCNGTFTVFCDRNECSSGDNDCHQFADCTDLRGETDDPNGRERTTIGGYGEGYTCQCKPGYVDIFPGDHMYMVEYIPGALPGTNCMPEPREPCRIDVRGQPEGWSVDLVEIDQMGIEYRSVDNAWRLSWDPQDGQCEGWRMSVHPDLPDGALPGPPGTYSLPMVPHSPVLNNRRRLYELPGDDWVEIYRTRMRRGDCQAGAQYPLGDVDLMRGRPSPMYPLAIPFTAASTEPVCRDMMQCLVGTTCVMPYADQVNELQRAHISVPTVRLCALGQPQRTLVLTDQWATEFGFPKIVTSPERVDAMLRLCAPQELSLCGPPMMYGKDLNRQRLRTTRMRVAQVEAEVKYVSASMVSSEPFDVKFHFGDEAFAIPPSGFTAVGDAIRVETADSAQNCRSGPIKIDVFLPDRTSASPPQLWQHGKLTPLQPAEAIWLPGLRVAAHYRRRRRRTPRDAHRRRDWQQLDENQPLGDYFWTVEMLPGDAIFVEDTDECAGEHNPCEATLDGGICTNLQGGYRCSCQEGFIEFRGQCLRQGGDAPFEQQATWVLVRPTTAKPEWTVPEMRVYSDRCRTQVTDGTWASSAPRGPDQPVLAGDGLLSTAFVATDQEPWIALLVPGTAGCVDIVTGCGGVELEVAVGRPTDVPTHVLLGPEPPQAPELENIVWFQWFHLGEPEEALNEFGEMQGSRRVILDAGATDAQVFGELLQRYHEVPNPLECLALCTEALDEGCLAWKWYNETAECQLLETVGPGPHLEEGRRVDGRVEGGWYDVDASRWHGWVAGLPPPSAARLALVSAAGQAELTLEGHLHAFGFPGAHSLPPRGINPEAKVVAGECGGPVQVQGISCSQLAGGQVCTGPTIRPAQGQPAVFGPVQTRAGKFVVCACAGECTRDKHWHQIGTWDVPPSQSYVDARGELPPGQPWTLEIIGGNADVSQWRASVLQSRKVQKASDCSVPPEMADFTVGAVQSCRENACFPADVPESAVGAYTVCVKAGPDAPWEIAFSQRESQLVVQDTAISRTAFSRQVLAAKLGDAASPIDVQGKNLFQSTFHIGAVQDSQFCFRDDVPGDFTNLPVTVVPGLREPTSEKVPFTLTSEDLEHLTGGSAGLYDVCWCDPQYDETLVEQSAYTFAWTGHGIAEPDDLTVFGTEHIGGTDVMVSYFDDDERVGKIRRFTRSNVQFNGTVWEKQVSRYPGTGNSNSDMQGFIKMAPLGGYSNGTAGRWLVAFTTPDYLGYVALFDPETGEMTPDLDVTDGGKLGGFPALSDGTPADTTNQFQPYIFADVLASNQATGYEQVRNVAIKAFSSTQILIGYSKYSTGVLAGYFRAATISGDDFTFGTARSVPGDATLTSDGSFLTDDKAIAHLYDGIDGSGAAYTIFAAMYSIKSGGIPVTERGYACIGRIAWAETDMTITLNGLSVHGSGIQSPTVVDLWGGDAQEGASHVFGVYYQARSSAGWTVAFSTFGYLETDVGQHESGFNLILHETLFFEDDSYGARASSITHWEPGDPSYLLAATSAASGIALRRLLWDGTRCTTAELSAGTCTFSGYTSTPRQALLDATPGVLSATRVGEDEVLRKDLVLLLFSDEDTGVGKGSMAQRDWDLDTFALQPGDLKFTYKIDDFKGCDAERVLTKEQIEEGAWYRKFEERGKRVPFCQVCREGCVGAACVCSPESRFAADNVLCARISECQDICNELSLESPYFCDGVDYDEDTRQCVLTRGCDASRRSFRPNTHHWEKHNGLACREWSDFQDQHQLVGTLAVGKRADVGQQWVVAPDQVQTLEVMGERMSYDNAVLVVPCTGACGLSDGARLVPAPPAACDEVEPGANGTSVCVGGEEDGHVTKLRFADVVLSSGEYKVCFCDRDLQAGDPPCSRPADFLLDIGSVYASTLTCLASEPSFVRTTCTQQDGGGLRCARV